MSGRFLLLAMLAGIASPSAPVAAQSTQAEAAAEVDPRAAPQARRAPVARDVSWLGRPFLEFCIGSSFGTAGCSVRWRDGLALDGNAVRSDTSDVVPNSLLPVNRYVRPRTGSQDVMSRAVVRPKSLLRDAQDRASSAQTRLRW